MYTDYKNYPNLEKLPNNIEESLDELEESKHLKLSFGEDVISSYIKLKRKEIEDFDQNDNFDKKRPITDWEKQNTLDC